VSDWQKEASGREDDTNLGASERARRDVEKFLGQSFDVRDVDRGFAEVEDFAGDGPMGNGSWAAVAWEFECFHVGPNLFLGIEPTKRQVTIEGVTLVNQNTNLFQRYIHLPGLLGQLGVTLTRPTIESPTID
jgi:hypothetical protein